MLGPEPAIGGSDEEDADEEGPPPAGEAVLYVSAEESVEQVHNLLICTLDDASLDELPCPHTGIQMAM